MYHLQNAWGQLFSFLSRQKLKCIELSSRAINKTILFILILLDVYTVTIKHMQYKKIIQGCVLEIEKCLKFENTMQFVF